MVSDNHKTNSLTSPTDDETTTELEALADTFQPHEDYDDELEADANTFEFEDLAAVSRSENDSISVLRADLVSRTESVNRLQYDIEQLRLRWTGLEKEIKAREQATENVNEELRKTKRKLAKAKKALRRREEENRSLAEALQKKNVELDEAAARIDELGTAVEKNDEALELAAARTTVAELEQYIDARKDEWQRQEQALRDGETRFEESAREIDRLSKELERQSDELSDGKTESAKLGEELKARQEDLKRLRRDNRELRQALQNDTARQIEKAREKLERQSGRLTANEHEIRILRDQLGRSESYADDLRCKLQEQTSSTSRAVIAQGHLQTSLDRALDDISRLEEELAAERQAVDELKAGRQRLQEDFDQQIRQIRSELDAAQETISDHETINAQLTSDLIDHRGFRQALEDQLSSSERESGKTIRGLERKLKRLESGNEELQEKLRNKDSAIAALLSELASRSRTIETIGEMETVIHEIDGRMSERIDEESGGERERTARLLIGRVDGQELRFPLFKDRLTVGRSAHNDIQLNAQYISRRHAVIVTEGENTKIVDWGSKNGVFVNELRVAEQRLQNGDIVTIGMADFKYQEHGKR